jgi:hypothetical protein
MPHWAYNLRKAIVGGWSGIRKLSHGFADRSRLAGKRSLLAPARGLATGRETGISKNGPARPTAGGPMDEMPTSLDIACRVDRRGASLSTVVPLSAQLCIQNPFDLTAL